MEKYLISIFVCLTILFEYSAAQALCVTCYSNDTESDSQMNCIYSPEIIRPIPCLNSEDSCFMSIEEGHTVRGCLGSLSESEQAECDIISNSCQKCSSNSPGTTTACNDILWPPNRQMCHQCMYPIDYEVFPECRDPGEETPVGCPLYVENDKCYVFRRGAFVYRGCMSEGPLCDATDECHMCDGYGCNTIDGGTLPEIGGEPARCTTCNSSNFVESYCATIPGAIESSKRLCDKFDDLCYQRITEDGATVRGCLGELTETELENCSETKNNQCEICQHRVSMDTCNTEIYPENRLKCHDCFGSASSVCSAAQTSTENVKICLLYDESDHCYVRRYKNGEVHRGCVSNWPDCSDPAKCFWCEGEGCNALDGTDELVPEYSFGVQMSFSFSLLAILFFLQSFNKLITIVN